MPYCQEQPAPLKLPQSARTPRCLAVVDRQAGSTALVGSGFWLAGIHSVARIADVCSFCLFQLLTAITYLFNQALFHLRMWRWRIGQGAR